MASFTKTNVMSNIFIQFENKIVENWCITNQIYASLQCYIDKKSPNEIELKSESTLQGEKDCCHIVLFFEGSIFYFQPCHY